MAKLVIYEWLIEQVDEHGDIQDVDHRDTAAEMFAAMRRNEPDPGMHYEFGLVRDQYHHDDPGELVLRQWAYVEGGVLPAEMDEGAKVPKRLADEFARAAG